MTQQEKNHRNPAGSRSNRPLFPSGAIRKSSVYFRSAWYGCVGAICPDGRRAANRSALNVKAILEVAGFGMENIVKTTVFLKDMNDFQAVNEVYASFFSEPYPARSAVEVARLPKDGLVEIEVVASKS